tara:strand:- start:215 stop:583 length:369 start_codon:yes stop_codon:yes gene_type:complete
VKSFVLKSGILAALILIASYSTPSLKGVSSTIVWPAIVVLYFCLNVLFSIWVKKAKKASPLGFSVAVNGMTAAKMFITLGIITVYLVTQTQFKKEFSIGVFIVFAINSVLFVMSSQKIVRKG